MKTTRTICAILCFAMLLALLPSAAFAAATAPTVNGSSVYANGVPLFISEAMDGNVLTTYVCTGGFLGETGYTGTVTSWSSDYTGSDNHYVYGGCESGELTADTAIYMKSGSVGYICGGNYGAKLTGSTDIQITGGTLRGVVGGSDSSAAGVTDDVSISISGAGTTVGNIYGSMSAPIGGDSSVSISGGTIRGSVVGGGYNGNATVGGNSSVVISGGSISSEFELFVVGGGFSSGADVAGNSSVTISGGVVSGANACVIGGGYNSTVGTADKGNTAKVIITGGTVDANVFVQYNGGVNGEMGMELSGGVAKRSVYSKRTTTATSGAGSISVSGGFTTVGDGKIALYSTVNNRVEIAGELNGDTEQMIKLEYKGTPGSGAVVAHAANPDYAVAAKFTLVDYSANEYPLVFKANATSGGDVAVSDETFDDDGFGSLGGYQPATLVLGEDDTGSYDDYYEISSAGQLFWYAKLINGTLNGGYVKAGGRLTGNISLNDESFTFQPDTGLVLVTDGENTAYLGTGLKGESGGNTLFDETASYAGTWYDEEYAEDYEAYGGKLRDWTPISYNSLSLVFDGGGYTVSGLFYNNCYALTTGMFGYNGNADLYSDVIRGLNVTGCVIGGSEVGGICGASFATIENCSFSGIVIGAENPMSDYASSGGICGVNNGGAVSGCESAGLIIGLSKNVGGICGENNTILRASLRIGSLSGCRGTARILGTDFVGGVCGINYGGKVMSCYTAGSVAGEGENTGGVCGLSRDYAYIEYGENDEETEKVIPAETPSCVYLDSCGAAGAVGTAMTVGQLGSGAAAWYLNGGETQAVPQIWYQTIGADDLPVLDSTHKKVYLSGGVYTNVSPWPELSFNDSAAFDVPTGAINTEIAPIDLSAGIVGGSGSYSYTLERNTDSAYNNGVPAWLTVSGGKLSGTRPSEAAPATAVTVRITDSMGEQTAVNIIVNSVTETGAAFVFPDDPNYDIPPRRVGQELMDVIILKNTITGATGNITLSIAEKLSEQELEEYLSGGNLNIRVDSVEAQVPAGVITVLARDGGTGATATIQLDVGEVFDSAFAPSVCVGGVELKNGDSTAQFGGSAAYADGVLTLDGVTVPRGSGRYRSAVYIDGDLTLNLKGESTITGPDTGYENISYGLYVGGSLTVTGEGSLAVSGGSASAQYGAYCGGDARIESGALSCLGGNGFVSYGLIVYGSLTVDGGSLSGRVASEEASWSVGVTVVGERLTLNSGTVTAVGGGGGDCSYGFFASYGVFTANISGGSLTATGGQAPTSRGVMCNRDTNNQGTLNITGGTVTAGSVSTDDSGTRRALECKLSLGDNIIARGSSAADGSGLAEYDPDNAAGYLLFRASEKLTASHSGGTVSYIIDPAALNGSATVVIAQYESGGKMKGAFTASIDPTAPEALNGSNADAPFTPADGDIYKVFLVDSADGTPLCAAAAAAENQP